MHVRCVPAYPALGNPPIGNTFILAFALYKDNTLLHYSLRLQIYRNLNITGGKPYKCLLPQKINYAIFHSLKHATKIAEVSTVNQQNLCERYFCYCDIVYESS